MARDNQPLDDIINASDISRYVYCRRAWWYDRQGISSINIEELQTGIRRHRRHGIFVRLMAVLAMLAALLIIVGVFLAGVYFLQLAAGG